MIDSMEPAGLIFDDSPHYIDHLAPFCAQMDWPLWVCDPAAADLCRAYYPDLDVVEKDLFALALPNPLLACDPLALLNASFPGKPIRSLWLPHGNSDKGWRGPLFEALSSSETALVYGQKMIDFLRQKQVSARTVPIGNFRASYWESHRSFYTPILQEKILSRLPANPIYLYAPTWSDQEDNGSFWKAFPELAEALPSSLNLLVKLHPNIRRKDEIRLEVLLGRYEKRPNILFLEDFPPVYPLLSLASAYIGDMSSIGYDFLYFNKPMYFLNPNQRDAKSDPGLYLFRCGIETDPSGVFLHSQKSDALREVRQKTYNYTFAPVPKWADLKKKLAL